MYIYCVYRKYIHYSPICPVQIHTFTVGWNCQSHNPRNLIVLNENFEFDIGVIFQEHNRGLKCFLGGGVLVGWATVCI